MAKSKYIRIPVSLFWPQDKAYKDKNKFTEELKALVRAKALQILDAEYAITYSSYDMLKDATSESSFLVLPKPNKKKYFSYDPGTGQMYISVFLSLKTANDMDLVKKADTAPSPLGITDYLVLDFDENYSDNSPIIKTFKSLKAILQSVIKLGDKSGIDLYREKHIV